MKRLSLGKRKNRQTNPSNRNEGTDVQKTNRTTLSFISTSASQVSAPSLKALAGATIALPIHPMEAIRQFMQRKV
jgi:hypothetical protein